MAAEIIINPIGNFPLNDDWSYAKPVESLTAGKGLQLVNWPAMTLVAQLKWAQLFTSVFGFSFTVLRFSVIVPAVIGSFYLFALLFRISGNRKNSFMLTLLLCFNPLCLSLTNSFMTDVTFLCCMIISFYYLHVFISDTTVLSYLLISSLFMVAAIMIRQLALFIPAALALTFLSGKEKRKWIYALVPFMMCFLSLLIYEYWLKKLYTGPSTYQPVNKVLDGIFPLVHSGWRYIMRMGKFLYYAGIFFSPVLIFSAVYCWRHYSGIQRKYAVFAALGLSFIVVRCFTEVPVGNIFYDCGIGPRLLYDDFHLRQNTETDSSLVLITMMRILGAACALCFFIMLPGLFLALNRIVKARKGFSFDLFLLISVFGYSGLFFIFQSFSDRYYIPLFLLLMLLTARQHLNGRIASLVTYGFTIVLLLFSLGFTHDYLEWNRKRWEAIEYARNNLNAPDEMINGGFEHAGWAFCGSGDDYWFRHWSARQNYLVTFGELEGYQKVKSFSYRRWVPLKTSEILLLQKK